MNTAKVILSICGGVLKEKTESGDDRFFISFFLCRYSFAYYGIETYMLFVVVVV